MKKKEFPSQKKYRDNHPTISFRLTKLEKERLDTIIRGTGIPLSQWLSDFINNKMDPEREISELVQKIDQFEEYMRELDAEEGFTIPCCVCGKPVKFSSTQSKWTTKVQPILKQAFSTWKHSTCTTK